MTENHFRPHLSPFHINTQLSFFFKFHKMPAAILDDRKSFSIAFLAISDQYATFIFRKFRHKCPPAVILDHRKSLSIAFLAISDQCATFFCLFLTKLTPAAILDDQKSLLIAPLIAFLAISYQYTSLIFLKIWSLNGRRRLFWMTEYHFRSHLISIRNFIQILSKFHKMAAGGHFGWLKISFYRISCHFIFNTQLFF